MKIIYILLLFCLIQSLQGQYDTVHVVVVGENVNTKAIKGILLAQDTQTQKLTDFNAPYPKETTWAEQMFGVNFETKAKKTANEILKAQTNDRYAFHSHYQFEERTWPPGSKTNKVYFVKVPYIQAQRLNEPFMGSASANNQWRKNFQWISVNNLTKEKNVDGTVLKMLQQLAHGAVQALEASPSEQLQATLGQLKQRLEILKEKLI